MFKNQIEESITLLQKNWQVEPILIDFMLGKRIDVVDHMIKVRNVVFHIPYLTNEKKYILWKCYWPDCHNCCERQGRLPLTSDDLIIIGKGLKYAKISEFVKNETVVATWMEPGPSGNDVLITSVNLKRKQDETEADDGTHISCRFLDEKGACTMHPNRPGVCYMYPFSAWLANESGRARVHSTFQFTGDCPGFYLSESLDSMKEILREYSQTIYDYAMRYTKTTREGLSVLSFV